MSDWALEEVAHTIARAISTKCPNCPCCNGCNVEYEEDCIERIEDWLNPIIAKIDWGSAAEARFGFRMYIQLKV